MTDLLIVIETLTIIILYVTLCRKEINYQDELNDKDNAFEADKKDLYNTINTLKHSNGNLTKDVEKLRKIIEDSKLITINENGITITNEAKKTVKKSARTKKEVK